MNILIPHKWLLEHLQTSAHPEELQKIVSLSGPSVERIYDREGDSVYDVEVTTNRVDAMSIRGFAREAAVILTQAGKASHLKPLTVDSKHTKKSGAHLPLPKIIDKAKICKRTMAVVLADVERSETPDWMGKRLKQVDENIHDAVIDITNYITHELGHPCHAFDYDAIMQFGGSIIVTKAKPGRVFVTLDGEKYKTVGGEIVFENEGGEIIDLPGIKGTANTSISSKTKHVLLWIENIPAELIRFGSMTHAIRTIAAQLNEKHVDPHLAKDVLLRGIELFTTLCHARVASEIFDSFPSKAQPKSVTVPLATFTRYLGLELPIRKITTILEQLDCRVSIKPAKKTGESASLIVTPPTFRPDLTIPADIVEEVARIYGYHNLPSVLMDTAIPTIKPDHTNFRIEERMKRFLAARGWQELYTYSMVSAAIAEESGHKLDKHLAIQNPLTDDRVYMRRTLVPSLREVINQNTTHQQSTLQSIFELAYAYHPKKSKEPSLPNEVLLFSMVSTHDYRTVRGELEALLSSLYIRDIQVKNIKASGPFEQRGEILVKQGKQSKAIGTIGTIAHNLIAVEIEMPALLDMAKTHPEYHPIPTTNEIIEDYTFELPIRTPIGEVTREVVKFDKNIIQASLNGDEYRGKYTLSVHYQDETKQLKAEDIAMLRKKMIRRIEKKFRGQLVGEV